jgi:hypothetical protein
LAPAKAATLVGDTRVAVTFNLASAGITPSLLGNASIAAPSPLTLNFPVTGGSLTEGIIRHDNSGVRLTAGTNFVDIGDFKIDLNQQVIMATVQGNGGAVLTEVPVFSFNLSSVTAPDPFVLSNPSLALFFTATASSALNTILALGLSDPLALAGVEFGRAATSASEVPLPAAAWLFLAGLGGLAMRARKKEKRALA